MTRPSRIRRSSLPKIDLDALFGRQRGIATRRQLLAAGLDDEAIRREVHGGRWQRILPGMYACFTGPLTIEHRRVAAVLYAPPDAQITGLTALRWHGFRHLPDDDQVHMLIPHRSRRTSRGFVRFQRTERLDLGARRHGNYVVCSVARAVADAARQLNDLRAVRALVAEAIQRSLTDVRAIRRELDQAASHRTRLLRVAINEVGDGVRSAPEAELAEELAQSTVLPEVLWNPRLVAPDGSNLPTPDAWIADSGIAIEVDSREYHLGPEDWQRTMRRHNQLVAHGALVLHFTPSEIRRSRAAVRHIVEKAHLERVSSGSTASIRLMQDGPSSQDGSRIPA